MCTKIYFTDQLVEKYSKKIYGFAFNKTKDVNQAEDLSQEIFLNLAKALNEGKEIESLNQYIYTLCYYTWSKYVRKNIKSWRDESIEYHFEIADKEDIEADYLLQEDLKKLRQEITYLAKLQRQITIAFYYENKTSQDVAKELGITDGTVRWHLTDIRKKLRGGIEKMNDTLSYKPQRLEVGHEGWVQEWRMSGLKDDLLCQNIVLACYGEALTVEEIARTLGVAAAYLEGHIERLVFNDYLKIIGKNKYQTNFWIKTMKVLEEHSEAVYKVSGPLAEGVYHKVKDNLEAIRQINFSGNDIEENELVWNIVNYYITRTYGRFMDKQLERNKVTRPKRKDGTEHWVIATKTSGEAIDHTYSHKVVGQGVKKRLTELGICSLQLDKAKCRVFENEEIHAMYRIKQVINRQEMPNENDKLMISKMVELGYVEVENEEIKIKVPFFDHTQITLLNQIMDRIEEEIGDQAYHKLFHEVGEIVMNHIPDFIAKEEKLFHKSNVYPHFAIISWLIDRDYLKQLTSQQAKRIGTILWVEK